MATWECRVFPLYPTDRIKVGKKDKKNDYTEERAVSLLSNIDTEGFRELFHIPKDEELIASGMSREFVDNIKLGMPRKLEGWLNIARRRAVAVKGKCQG